MAADDRRAVVCKILKETGMEINEGGVICVHDELVARSLRNNPIPQCMLDKLDARARNVLLATREFYFRNYSWRVDYGATETTLLMGLDCRAQAD